MAQLKEFLLRDFNYFNQFNKSDNVEYQKTINILYVDDILGVKP